jgi:hypothetical protein
VSLYQGRQAFENQKAASNIHRKVRRALRSKKASGPIPRWHSQIDPIDPTERFLRIKLFALMASADVLAKGGGN